MTRYLGTLPHDDPLHQFLVDCTAFPNVSKAPEFSVYSLDQAETVFRYSSPETTTDVVGKFYGRKWIDGSQNGQTELRTELMYREFQNLMQIRSLGLDSPPNMAVRPFACNEGIGCVLLEEFSPGKSLHSYVWDATHGEAEALWSPLEYAARFLAKLHNVSRQNECVRQHDSLHLFHRVIQFLIRWNVINDEQVRQLEHELARWEESGVLAATSQVLIHGDATPNHFLFGATGDVTVIDWERMWPGDGAADIGYLAAELKHLFWWYTRDVWRSEPYIRHLYHSYFNYSAEPAANAFQFTERGRFFMGVCLLRISRNHWIDLPYRRDLVMEALACLRT